MEIKMKGRIGLIAAMTVFFAPPGRPFNARLVVRGPSRCRGEIAYSVVDLFGRKMGEGKLPFDLSKGEQVLPAFDEAFFARKGVYAIRLNVSGEGFLPYFDCVRLARFAYADAPAPNRRLHQLHGITWPTKAQTNDFTRIRRQYNALGLQPRSMALSGYAGDFTPALGHAIIAKNDTVYLLRPKKDASGMLEVFRREAPDHQLTGGVDRGLLPNVVEPAVEVTSEMTGDRRTFTCVFPGRQLEPAMLRAGRRIGFAQDALGFDDTYVTVEFAK